MFGCWYLDPKFDSERKRRCYILLIWDQQHACLKNHHNHNYDHLCHHNPHHTKISQDKQHARVLHDEEHRLRPHRRGSESFAEVIHGNHHKKAHITITIKKSPLLKFWWKNYVVKVIYNTRTWDQDRNARSPSLWIPSSRSVKVLSKKYGRVSRDSTYFVKVMKKKNFQSAQDSGPLNTNNG